MGEEVEIKIVRYRVDLDPTITIEVFSVEITDGSGSWKETIPSDENLQWFLRGVSAGASIFAGKHVSLPEIPRNAEPMPAAE